MAQLFSLAETPAHHNITLGLPRDPIDLLHPLIYSNENLHYAQQAYAQLQSDLAPAPVNPIFEKENLQQIEQHKWLTKTQCTLYTDSLDKLLQELRDTAQNAEQYIDIDERPIIALDLETTSLHKGVKVIQGKVTGFNKIVGVCIAQSETQGYYLPVNHNTLDDIPNYPQQDIIAFLQQLVDEFHIIYHNAVFDQEVMALNGVRFANSSFSDTLLLAFLMGWKQDYNQLGLKFLSKTLLERPMLEINEITGNKGVVRMQTIPAKNAYVYGCSDAMNTYGLFNYITEHKDNPLKTQATVSKIIHSGVFATRSMFRVGLPVDYIPALKATKTLLRRMIMLENIYQATISDQSVSMKSAEQLGMHFLSILKPAFESKYNNNRPLTRQDKGFDILAKRLKTDFAMEVKFKQLKGQPDKLVSNCDKVVFSSIPKTLHTWDFLDPAKADELYVLCSVLNEYGSLDVKMKIFIALIRNCFNDDLSMCRTPINLRLVGADTCRFSNGGSKNGAWDRVQVIKLKTQDKVEFIEGQGMNEFNAQGLSHESGNWKTLRKVKNFKSLNPKFKEVSTRLDKLVESRLYDYIIGGTS